MEDMLWIIRTSHTIVATKKWRLIRAIKIKEKCSYANILSLKIARLGIDKNHQGNRLGEFLIQYTVNLAVKARDNVGIKFITVDCYKHRVSYYEKNGFVINNVQAPDRKPHHPLSLRLNIDNYLDNLHIWIIGTRGN
jgi:predicted GNAT family N-acyltransferase